MSVSECAWVWLCVLLTHCEETSWCFAQMYAESKHVTPVGFERALSQRLRPLGQSVLTVDA